ncbi:MAG TPA: MarR family transcriptional regulator [Thermoanaerobaculia bacterium]|nr:MarR family transcriptional regulator [Thermoanaerobaculia bacterium]
MERVKSKRSFLSPLHKSTRQIGLYFEQQASGSGLTPQEGHLLTYLRSYAPAPVGDLVRVFGVKASSMTSILDRLEEEGLIERQLNPDDRRSLIVTLTKRGRTQAAAMQRFVEETEEEIASRLTEKEIDGFFAVMQAIAELTRVEVRPGGTAVKVQPAPKRRPRRAAKSR